MKMIARLCMVSMLGLSGLPAFAETSDVSITNSWIRLLPPTVKTTAAYMDITSVKTDTLISVSSDRAMMVELHETSMENGLMTMAEVSKLDIPENTRVSLSPQGLHLMVMGLKTPLQAGEMIPFTLNFEQAGAITIQVPVESR